MRIEPLVAALLVGTLAQGVLAGGCARTNETERRASERATAAAEDIARTTSLTSATLEAAGERSGAPAADADARALRETLAALRLEQADLRSRLQRALDALDLLLSGSRERPPGVAAPLSGKRLAELRAHRDRLRADLEAVRRSTVQDWATLRPKVEHDLASARQGERSAGPLERKPAGSSGR